MWHKPSLLAGVLMAATGSVGHASTWTMRPVPRPEASVYSGAILRPVPRPGSVSKDPATDTSSLEIPGATAPLSPDPVPDAVPLSDEFVPEDDRGEADTNNAELTQTTGEAATIPYDAGGAVPERVSIDVAPGPDSDDPVSEELVLEDPVPDSPILDSPIFVGPSREGPGREGGPAYMRPALRPIQRPDTGLTPRAEPLGDRANVLVSSPLPKPRPNGLILRAAAKPVAPAAIPPRPVATPSAVPRPAAKIKPVPPAAVPPRPADVVMVGDSITAGGRWSSRFPNVVIVNRGVSGDTGSKILARMDGILASKPDTALVMFGINDIYNGVPVDLILQRYDQIVSILLAQKINVVIQSTLACSGHICGEKLAKVYALNAGLSRLAKKRRLKFVDINKGLADQTGLKRAYSSDGIHLNRDGYATWYAMLRPHIRS